MLQLLATPLGNLEDITIRTLKAFEIAEFCFCEDTRVAGKLFSLLREKELLQRKVSPPFISLHEHNQKHILEKYSETLKNHLCIYISDAGMPAISDPGSELIRFCVQHHIEYEVFPGASASITAFCASGSEIGKFFFYGFLSKKEKERQHELHTALTLPYPVIFYEAPHRLLQFSEELLLFGDNRQLFAIKEISKLHEQTFHGTVKEFHNFLLSNSPRGEWVIITFPLPITPKLSFSFEEIYALELPPKLKAKFLSQIGTKSSKEYYSELISLR